MILLIKLLVWFLRKFTSHSATALPGLLLEKYAWSTFVSLCGQLDEVVMVSGTNGKTTTTKMISHLLSTSKIPHMTNRGGSNMIRGIATTLIDNCDWSGKLQTKTAVFEVEEGTMPRLVKLIKPKIVVVTNIFRDQLDAYGEVDKIASYLAQSIEIAKPELLILNADDDRVSALSAHTSGKVVRVGFAKKYRDVFKWENRHNSSSNADILIDNITLDNDFCPTFDFKDGASVHQAIKIQSPGIHNAFNAVCALLVVKNLTNEWMEAQLQHLSPAFGRGEKIEIDNAKFKVLLVKNPAGMNLNLGLIKNHPGVDAVLFLLNDHIADGTDVSWIWDCEFETMARTKCKIYVSGDRCWDMAIRLQYAGLNVEKVFVKMDQAVNELKKINGQIVVLPSYTAMLEFRKIAGGLTKINRMHEK